MSACAVAQAGAQTQPSQALSANQGVTVAQIESLDPIQAEQERIRKQAAMKPATYQDKFMDSSALSELTPSDDDEMSAADLGSGLGLRTYGMESRLGFNSYSAAGNRLRELELGQRIYLTQQTLNYGEWSLQAEGRLRNTDESSGMGLASYGTPRGSARVALRNFGLPLGNGWFADSALGDQYTELTSALTRNYRLYLGGSVVRGAGTRLYAEGLDITAGVGERGLLNGGPYPGFDAQTGSLAWLGASKQLGGGWYGGIQVTQATGIPQTLYSNWLGNAFFQPTGARESVTALAAAVGWSRGNELAREGDYRWRLTTLQSETGANVLGRQSRAGGLFLEVGARMFGLRHELGVYQADPNLRFGENLIASDNRGAYWRVDGNTTRLSWGLGLDYMQNNPGKEVTRQTGNQWGVYGNGQYRFNRDNLMGVSATWNTQRHLDPTTLNLNSGQRNFQASTYYQTRVLQWAPTRLRLNVWRNQELVLNDVPADGEELTWEQEWITGKFETMRPELMTTLGYARDRSGGQQQTYPTAGVQGRYWINSNWSLGGLLRYTARSSNLFTSRGLSGNVNSEADLGSGWHLGMTLMLNQVRVATQNIVGLTAPQVMRSNDKSLFVYLRWDGSTGRSLRAIGASDGRTGGGGTVRGVVFMDANNDGEQQVSERGTSGVEVILDGRYRTMTDAAGQFEFPMVATGSHQLTVRAESVPLPWGPTPEGRVSVEVPLRGVVNTRVPVIRVGGGE